MTETLIVEERGQTIAFTFDDMIRYHGPHSPAGVAVAFKAMLRAFPVAVTPTRPYRGDPFWCARPFVVLARATDSKRSPARCPTTATAWTAHWCGRTVAACSRTSFSSSPLAMGT